MCRCYLACRLRLGIPAAPVWLTRCRASWLLHPNNARALRFAGLAGLASDLVVGRIDPRLPKRSSVAPVRAQSLVHGYLSNVQSSICLWRESMAMVFGVSHWHQSMA